jgi:hypothetical protein
MFPESDVYNPKSELDAIRAVVDANPDLAALIAVLAGLLVLLLLGSVAERVVQRLRRPRQRERVTAGRIRRP